MKNKNINLAIKILITSLLVFMFISCNEGITTADENVSTNKNANFLKLGNYDLQNVNKSIDTFSKILASTLNDIGMRKIIFDSVGKKFDGDYDILFMNESALKSRV